MLLHINIMRYLTPPLKITFHFVHEKAIDAQLSRVFPNGSRPGVEKLSLEFWRTNKSKFNDDPQHSKVKSNDSFWFKLHCSAVNATLNAFTWRMQLFNHPSIARNDNKLKKIVFSLNILSNQAKQSDNCLLF